MVYTFQLLICSLMNKEDNRTINSYLFSHIIARYLYFLELHCIKNFSYWDDAFLSLEGFLNAFQKSLIFYCFLLYNWKYN